MPAIGATCYHGAMNGDIFRMVPANGIDIDIDIEVLEAGSGEHLALCLHGFPEHAIAWRHQIPALVALGYRVWAPNQRGYGRTTRPRDVLAYSMPHLLDDIAGLIDASGARSVTMLGHDWGAAVAWCFAMRRVRPIEIPTLMIWGENDVALDKATTAGTERYVRDLQVVDLPGISHWVQQDAAEQVNALLTTFLHPLPNDV